MTIILQHQFWGLKVTEEHFEVTLTFKKLPATLSIPFAALTAFFDPGVQFGLQFRGAEGESKGGGAAQPTLLPQPAAEQGREKPPADAAKPATAVESAEKPAAPGEVVSLDAFRKK